MALLSTDASDTTTLQDQGFPDFYESMEEKPVTTVRIFDRNDYYTVHGKDAEFVAKEHFKTDAVIKKHKGPHNLSYVNLSKTNFETLVKNLLLVKNYCVEIYKKSAGKSTQWNLDCKGTPGNLTELEDLIFSSSEVTESCGLMALKIKIQNQDLVVGISFVDTHCRKFLVAEICTNSHLSALQNILVQLGPKECVLPTSNEHQISYEKVTEILKHNNILVSKCKASNFSDKDLIQDLNRLIKFGKGEQKKITAKAEFNLSLAMHCTSAAVKHLELLKDERNYGQFKLNQFCPEQFARLDYSAIRALGILPINQREGDKSPTVLSLLNKCRTAGGQRLLSQWLKQPLLDIGQINERLDVVEVLVANTELRQALHDTHLRKVPDLVRYSKTFQQKKASLQDCHRMYLTFKQLPQLREILTQSDNNYQKTLDRLFVGPIQELEGDFEKYLELIETTLDFDEIENGEFLVRSNFDSDLKDLRDQLSDLEEEIQADLKIVSKDLEIEADKILKLEKNSQIGWHYRVTRKEEKALRNQRNYFIIDTKTNGVRFHSKELRQLNSSFIELRDSVEKHQKSLIEAIVDIAAGYSEPMDTMNNIIAHLDVLVAFAIMAVSAPRAYVRPRLHMKGTGKIILKQARHPLVEIQKTVGFIANDVTLEHDGYMFQIITGPNMGGKSTYIRSVGINVLLAQVGSFVACDEAEISVVDAIMTRVGAGDKQLRGISTFMGEMLETSAILRTATKDSLVIIDELGRGTSTYDGFGLAWAISEYLVKDIGCYSLFATHFHELTALAAEYHCVKNLHVTAVTSQNCFTLLYQVKPGICDQSFGIHVAELANFPKHIIQMAKEKVAEFEILQGHSSILVSLEGPSPKKRKKDEEEAQVIISDFLKKVKESSTEGKSEEEVSVMIESLKQELGSSQNGQIQKLLASSQIMNE